MPIHDGHPKTVVSRRARRNALTGFILAVILAVLLGTITRAHADPCADRTPAPSLEELRRAARRHAGLDKAASWRGRARSAALLPMVTLRAARALDWDDGGADSGLPTEVDNNLVFEARLTWRLDRLVYEPAEPRLDAVERDRTRARHALDLEVTTLYFRWRRAEVAAEDGDALMVIDAEEAWAQLDARTGSWLARQPCRR